MLHDASPEQLGDDLLKLPEEYLPSSLLKEDLRQFLATQSHRPLKEEELVVAQIAVRMHHAAWIVAELHRAVWDRAMFNSTKRLLVARNAIYEFMCAELFAETLMQTNSEALALSRLVCEIMGDVAELRKATLPSTLESSVVGQVTA
mmetsp:Transcript_1930/g.4532  ORF Transcript_1930/g.4532 Transcript_1930/m.4532 type:complete len:147 (-) Transcript_1930:1270-1710(-)